MSRHLETLAAKDYSGPRPRLAFFDIDGTLVNSRHEIGGATRAAVRRLHDYGIKIALASGRPYFAATQILDDLGINAPSMFFAGALIVDPASGEIIDEAPLSEAAARTVIGRARAKGIYLELYDRDNYYVELDSDLAAIHASYLGKGPIIGAFDQLIESAKILKCVTIMSAASDAADLRKFLAEFPDLTASIAPGASHPAITFGNLTSQAACRERAFDLMLARLGLRAADVVAFGDGDADIPFLTKAGVGVAMGDLNKRVTEAADLVTLDADHDGVALALDYLVFNRSK